MHSSSDGAQIGTCRITRRRSKRAYGCARARGEDLALEDPGSDVGAPEHRCYRRPPREEEKPRAGIEMGKEGAAVAETRIPLKAAPVRRNWNRSGGVVAVVLG
ncbi:hypothetical protein BHE74_00035043 [Ensete ventricosum]|nr:hypothetical protein BHE74_00035043 [Ensete ventricosum]